jgi:hypothetical protein
VTSWPVSESDAGAGMVIEMFTALTGSSLPETAFSASLVSTDVVITIHYSQY